MKIMKPVTISFTLLGIALGCASARNKTEVVEKTPNETQMMSSSEKAAVAMDHNIVSTIQFEPGRQALSAEATAELNKAILEAKQRGEVQEVDVAVWSDMEYPAQKGAKLPDQQVDLAKERGANIQKYLDHVEPDANVKVHNMAKQSSSFADFIHTQDATVKSKLTAMGVAPESDNGEVKGRSSSALVFIKLK